jgi:hypothetical protein
VSDAVQQDGTRASLDAQQDYGQAQDGRHRHKNGAYGQDKGGDGADSHQKGRRASIEWNKPILGKFEDVKEHYAFDKVLGKGQFGVTRLVVDTVTGEHCACKSISKRKLVSQEDMEDVRREIKVMHHLSGHPHVVTFKGGEFGWSHELVPCSGPNKSATQANTASTSCLHRPTMLVFCREENCCGVPLDSGTPLR